MNNERRSETPVSDTKLRSEVSVSVILQGAILAGIIALVTVTMSIKEQVAVYASEMAVVQVTIRDHEGRLRTIEMDHARWLRMPDAK